MGERRRVGEGHLVALQALSRLGEHPKGPTRAQMDYCLSKCCGFRNQPELPGGLAASASGFPIAGGLANCNSVLSNVSVLAT